jgi:hypothetical protein
VKVTITLLDMDGRHEDSILGPFDFVQITYGLIRGDNDDTIAIQGEDRRWYIPQRLDEPLRSFSDFVVTAAEDEE